MKRLDKMSSEVFSQMVANPVVLEKMSPAIKSFGITLLLGAAALASSGLAHADDLGNRALRVTSGTSGLFSILIDGAKPQEVKNADCDVQGTNGWKVAGAAVTGAYAGNQFGKGKGRAILTAGLGYLGASAAQSVENNRMREECARQISNRQRNQQYYQPASYIHNHAVPTAPILYESKNAQGLPYYVTIHDSPGLAALSGKTVGSQSLDSDPIVGNAFQKSANNLKSAYSALDKEAVSYLHVINGRGTADKLSRYAVDDVEVNASKEVMWQQQDKIANAKSKFEAAYTKYATSRALFANIADNASTDGFDLSANGEMLNYLAPPKSADLTQKDGLQNRYAVLPGRR